MQENEVLDWLSEYSLEFIRILSPLFRGEIPLPSRKIAVFDADWTLWSSDMGEGFFRWLIAGRLLKDVDYSKDIYKEYEEMVKKSRVEGYSWIVRLMKGHKEDDIKLWCRQFAYAWPNYRKKMRFLIEKLKEVNFEIWIVSASNDWVVKSASKYMGVDREKAIGIKVKVKNGVLTNEIIEPISCDEGKIEVIKKEIGIRPFLCFGDSLGDIAMLEYAEIPMVVGSREKENSPLLSIAKEKEWAVQMF